ncbi:MAG: hypothetical protein O3C60_10845 [Planctomycetota bacterium]|nr:hypothetical protein [Planctomycetota bacterium]
MPDGLGSIRYDAAGNAYGSDTHHGGYESQFGTTGGETRNQTPPLAQLSAVPLSGLPALHSRSSSAKKIFLDFDGHSVTGTQWNSPSTPSTIHAIPFDMDGEISTFNSDELTKIDQIWQRVSEDFAPFDIDVTTEEPNASVFTAGSQGIRILFSTRLDDSRVGGTGVRWYPENAGGVAYINSWAWRTDTPAWVFYDTIGFSDKFLAEAASHETGHTLGLLHDGQGNEEYYRGHGSGATSWAPIMGIGYHRAVTQWSRGEYANATNFEDDSTILETRLSYRPDDHSNAQGQDATPIDVMTGTVAISGVIERGTDVDVFLLDLGLSEGVVDLRINPATYGANLDILVRIFDTNGQLLTESNPLDQLSATISENLLPGLYYLTVEGTGNEPVPTGYSGYGSLGQFSITGTIQVVASGFAIADLNADGLVDGADAAILFANWGVLPTIVPPAPPVNLASASYNPWTGEIVISGNQITAWTVESPSGGLSAGVLPAVIPLNDGIVTNTPQRLQESAFTRFSFSNLNLGLFAEKRLADITLTSSRVSFGPTSSGTVLARYPADAAIPGTARGVFNLISGQLSISTNGVVRWYVESPSGGLIGLPPNNLPHTTGTVEDTDERIGESATEPFTVTDIDLGHVGLPRLPDLKLFYQTSPAAPIQEGELIKIGQGDFDLEGTIDGGDASLLYSNWTG